MFGSSASNLAHLYRNPSFSSSSNKEPSRWATEVEDRMQSLESENLAPNSKAAETPTWFSQKIRPAVLLPPNYLKAEAEDLRRRVRELEDALNMDAPFQVEDDNSETSAESACIDPIQSPLQAQLQPTDRNPNSLARCVRLLNLEIYNVSVSLARSLPLPKQTNDLEAYIAPRILQACLASWCTKAIQVRSSNLDDTLHADRPLGTRNSLDLLATKESLISCLVQVILKLAVYPMQPNEVKSFLMKHFNKPGSPQSSLSLPDDPLDKVAFYCSWIEGFAAEHAEMQIFLPEPGTPFDSETMFQLFSSSNGIAALGSHPTVLFACQMGLTKSEKILSKSGVQLEI